MATRQDTTEKLVCLRALLDGKATMLIALQSDPDPDGLASALALRAIANANEVKCSLACSGSVGRAENRALVRYANLNLRTMDNVLSEQFDLTALVDTQPGQSNSSLPKEMSPDIVIDHHPIRPETRRAHFTDIRSRYGATSTILYEYLEVAAIEPDTPLATALLYGIRSDTQDFGRQATQADIDASNALYGLANKRMLGAIQRGRVPAGYFHLLAVALDNARRCGKSVYSGLGHVDDPDMVAEVADLLYRFEEADWSLCWAYADGMVHLSVRTLSSHVPADKIVRDIVRREGSGGGHPSMAAGQILFSSGKVTDRKHLDQLIRQRFLKATGQRVAACRRMV